MRDIATTTISGNLTRDPELRSTPSRTSVCVMRVAFNTRRKDGEQWVDKANYIGVEAWGAQADSCAQYLRKGSRVFVTGELEYQEWADKDSGQKRSVIRVRAREITFEGGADPAANSNGAPPQNTPQPQPQPTSGGQRPAPVRQPVAAGNGGSGGMATNDLPF